MKILTEVMETSQAELTCYIQDTSIEMPHLNTRPAVLILPGGAYRFCSDREAEPVALAYLQHGFNAFVLRYTVGGKVPMDEVFSAALSDAEDAMKYLRANANKLHIDTNQIAVAGFSSGGNLAAALGIFSQEKPDALILGYASLEQKQMEKMGLHVPNLIEAVTESTPPTFLFATQGDITVPTDDNTLHFAQVLAEKNVPYEVHIFVTGGHGLSLANEVVWGSKGKADADVAQWLQLSVRFLHNGWSKKALVQGFNSGNGEFGIHMRMEQLMSDERSAALLEKHLPGIRDMMGGEPMAAGISLKKIAEYSRGGIPEEKMEALEEELQMLNVIKKRNRPRQTAVYPGKVWLDTKGERIQAHGGAMYYEDGTYYWYGENKEKTDGKNGIWTWGIRAYSSKDLYNWKDEGLMIPPDTQNPGSSLHPEKYVDRPHILKCKATGKYVCWIKLSGADACFTLLTADRFLGPYHMEKNTFYPLGQKVGDFDLVEDEDSQKAYLFMDSDHAGIVCMELTSDYLDIAREVSRQYEGLHAPFCREGVAVFERQGKKYMLTSGMSGYIPNKSDSAVSDSWTKSFVSIGDPHVDDESRASFNSQISKVFQVAGKKDLYIAMADRWVPGYVVDAKRADIIMRGIAAHYEPDVYKLEDWEKAELMNSPMLETANTSVADYVWLPLRFEGEKVFIDWKDEWKVEDYES